MGLKRLFLSVCLLMPLVAQADGAAPYISYDANTPEWEAQIDVLEKNLTGDKAILKSAASAQDKALASLRIGAFYMARKHAQSIPYLTQAANYHDAHISSPAAYNLAMVYLHGKGVKVDLDAAFKWFKTAAQKNNTEAVRELIVMCREQEVADKKLIDLARWAIQTKTQPSGSVTYQAGANVRMGLSSCPLTEKIVAP